MTAAVLTGGERDLLARARRVGGVGTLKQSFHTGIGLHRLGRQMVMRALQKGLAVDYRHDGAWFWRKHLLVVRGPAYDVALFGIALKWALGNLESEE